MYTERAEEELQCVMDVLARLVASDDCLGAARHLISYAIRDLHCACAFLGAVESSSTVNILAHEGFAWNLATVPSAIGVKALNEFLRAVVAAGTPVSINLGGRDVLGIPVFRGTELIGLIAVADRFDGYTAEQRATLERLTVLSGVVAQWFRWQRPGA